MQTSAMIYALVARGHETVLSSFSMHSGNFPSIALDVLRKCNLGKTFGQYATQNYCFYTFVKDGFVFLAMVEANYETRIAVSFLKKIQDQFFRDYDVGRRSSAVAHSLKEFNRVLEMNMKKYQDPSKVDKLSELRKQLTELEEQSLRNMDKVIERGEKIQILVQKSQTMVNQSLDVKDNARKVKNKMWWKNKKVLIGIILLVLLIIGIIIWVVVG